MCFCGSCDTSTGRHAPELPLPARAGLWASGRPALQGHAGPSAVEGGGLRPAEVQPLHLSTERWGCGGHHQSQTAAGAQSVPPNALHYITHFITVLDTISHTYSISHNCALGWGMLSVVDDNLPSLVMSFADFFCYLGLRSPPKHPIQFWIIISTVDGYYFNMPEAL